MTAAAVSLQLKRSKRKGTLDHVSGDPIACAVVNRLFTFLSDSLQKQSSGFSGRLLHGRGGTLDGLGDFSADLYGSLLFVVVYRMLSPEETAGAAGVLTRLVAGFRQSMGIRSALLQLRTPGGAEVLFTAGDAVSDKVAFMEEGLSYYIEPLRGQNPGFFFDTRDGRRWVRDHAAGARVLNLFAYTCAFSVAAFAGNALEVVNVDMKRAVLDRGKENHRINQGINTNARLSFLALDVMKSFSRIDKMGKFSMVIADPPSRQGQSFQYLRDYPKLIRRAENWLAPDGQLLTFLNAPDAPEGWLEDQVRSTVPRLKLEGVVQKGENFPESDAFRKRLGLIWRG